MAQAERGEALVKAAYGDQKRIFRFVVEGVEGVFEDSGEDFKIITRVKDAKSTNISVKASGTRPTVTNLQAGLCGLVLFFATLGLLATITWLNHYIS